MPVYEIRRSVGGKVNEISLSPGDNVMHHHVLTHDVDGREMKLVASFWARNWYEARQAQDVILGWDK